MAVCNAPLGTFPVMCCSAAKKSGGFFAYLFFFFFLVSFLRPCLISLCRSPPGTMTGGTTTSNVACLVLTLCHVLALVPTRVLILTLGTCLAWTARPVLVRTIGPSAVNSTGPYLSASIASCLTLSQLRLRPLVRPLGKTLSNDISETWTLLLVPEVSRLNPGGRLPWRMKLLMLLVVFGVEGGFWDTMPVARPPKVAVTVEGGFAIVAKATL